MAKENEAQKFANIRKAKELWDAKQARKMKLVREQLARTAERTPEQIEAQKERKQKQRERRAA
jgi:hypothetical protein